MIQLFIITFLSIFIMSGCAGFGKDLKSFLKGNSGNQQQQQTQQPIRDEDDMIRYSETKNLPYDDGREYKRMSRKQFEDQEIRSDNSGSLWVMEGQDSYLFNENNVRLPGDLINVALDGQPEKQLSTKAKVIKDLTKKIESKRKVASTNTAEKTDPAAAGAEGATPAAGADGAAAPAAKPAEVAAKPAEEELDLGGEFDVKTVPTRIVEKLSDGNYRVKGSQNFMIGSKEYRVIVTGLVKPSDVTNNLVDSSKMLDSKFDIVRAIKR